MREQAPVPETHVYAARSSPHGRGSKAGLRCLLRCGKWRVIIYPKNAQMELFTSTCTSWQSYNPTHCQPRVGMSRDCETLEHRLISKKADLCPNLVWIRLTPRIHDINRMTRSQANTYHTIYTRTLVTVYLQLPSSDFCCWVGAQSESSERSDPGVSRTTRTFQEVFLVPTFHDFDFPLCLCSLVTAACPHHCAVKVTAALGHPHGLTEAHGLIGLYFVEVICIGL